MLTLKATSKFREDLKAVKNRARAVQESFARALLDGLAQSCGVVPRRLHDLLDKPANLIP